MLNKRALANDLTDAFIRYQYNLDNPMTFPSDRELFDTYRIDHILHNRVEGLVAGIMQIVDKHI